MYGRKGKRRCQHCRQWRQKCEYDDIRLPCTLCSERGLDCAAEQKVLPQEKKPMPNRKRVAVIVDTTEPEDDIQAIETVPRELRTPIDQTLPSTDGPYMEFYWRTSGMWFDLINDHMSDTPHPLAMCAAHRFGPHLSSKLVRASVLYYSSFRKERQLSYTGMQYLAQFFELARDAIYRESNVELVYACYVMCLYEMTCGRRLHGAFENHADGFRIAYENLSRSGELTAEEHGVLGRAYQLIVQMRQVASSRWHEDMTWFSYVQTVIQRMDAATSRSLSSTKTIAASKAQSDWIPKSHHLIKAEDLVYQLCALFNRLASFRRNGTTAQDSGWAETATAIGLLLGSLGRIILSPIPLPDTQQKPPSQYVLKDGVTTVPGDKFTRQLLTLYYIFQVQYNILVLEWSAFTWSEVIEMSIAIARLYPSPHESNYPAPDVRFVSNRGLFFAFVVAAESHNIGVNPNIRERLVDAYTLLEPAVE